MTAPAPQSKPTAVEGSQPANREAWHPSASDTFCVVVGAMMAGVGAMVLAGLPGFAAIVGLMVFLLGLACDLRRATLSIPLDDKGTAA